MLRWRLKWEIVLQDTVKFPVNVGLCMWKGPNNESIVLRFTELATEPPQQLRVRPLPLHLSQQTSLGFP